MTNGWSSYPEHRDDVEDEPVTDADSLAARPAPAGSEGPTTGSLTHEARSGEVLQTGQRDRDGLGADDRDGHADDTEIEVLDSIEEELDEVERSLARLDEHRS